MSHVDWNCRCGKVLVEVPTKGTRLVCYCESCRGFVTACGAEDWLDQWGGNDLLQVSAGSVRIKRGREYLRWTKMSEKGPARWYTACCTTPMVNTLSTPALSFASFQVYAIDGKEHLPPIQARVNLKGATGHVEGDRGSGLMIVLRLFWRAGLARISGRWRDNPFFDASRRPSAERQELT